MNKTRHHASAADLSALTLNIGIPYRIASFLELARWIQGVAHASRTIYVGRVGAIYGTSGFLCSVQVGAALSFVLAVGAAFITPR